MARGLLGVVAGLLVWPGLIIFARFTPVGACMRADLEGTGEALAHRPRWRWPRHRHPPTSSSPTGASTSTELSERVGISIVNLSILKNGHARAIRFTTLTRLCQALGCQPGDLLTHDSAVSQAGQPASRTADLTVRHP